MRSLRCALALAEEGLIDGSLLLRKGGAVVNATCLFIHTPLCKRSDRKVIVHSRDLSISLEYSDLEEFLNIDGRLER